MAEYIDRNSFIVSQCNNCDGYCEKVYCDCLSCKRDCRCEMIQDLSNFPAASVRENVKGHDTGEERYFKCSECGYGVADVYEAIGPVLLFEAGKEWNFCPNCGARMDGRGR